MPTQSQVPAPHVSAERATRGWSASELADPHANAAKHEKVRNMFGSIARSYDLNNRLHSLWMDQGWRRFAVKQAGPYSTDTVLDIACGTGDLSEAMARAGAAKVIGLDFTPEMLEIAGHKQKRLPQDIASRLEYRWADAQHLPFGDATADVISIAFGLRNIADPAQALREFSRVLRPGGRLVILEFADPRNPLVRVLNNLYCKRIMPWTATLISRDRSGAYRYLPASVSTFMAPESIQAALAESGFRAVSATPLTLGICMCYRAIRA